MMYCRLYMHTDIPQEKIVSLLTKHFGAPKKIGISDFVFNSFDICIRRNDSFDKNKLRTYPDGFLYYRYTAEAEIYKDIIPTMNKLSETLWDAGIPTVISADNEDEFNSYVFGL